MLGAWPAGHLLSRTSEQVTERREPPLQRPETVASAALLRGAPAVSSCGGAQTALGVLLMGRQLSLPPPHQLSRCPGPAAPISAAICSAGRPRSPLRLLGAGLGRGGARTRSSSPFAHPRSPVGPGAHQRDGQHGELPECSALLGIWQWLCKQTQGIGEKQLLCIKFNFHVRHSQLVALTIWEKPQGGVLQETLGLHRPGF